MLLFPLLSVSARKKVCICNKKTYGYQEYPLLKRNNRLWSNTLSKPPAVLSEGALLAFCWRSCSPGKISL